MFCALMNWICFYSGGAGKQTEEFTVSYLRNIAARVQRLKHDPSNFSSLSTTPLGSIHLPLSSAVVDKKLVSLSAKHSLVYSSLNDLSSIISQNVTEIGGIQHRLPLGFVLNFLLNLILSSNTSLSNCDFP